jgi:energy-coupling factor transporter ATP-binding protein EcfA2
VALSSLLVYGPQLLLLDDPFAGLDQEKTQQVMEILFDLSEKEGTTIIWTSHNPDSLSDWAHSALHVEGGQIVAEPV